MTIREFANALRILMNIDGDEFIQAVYGRDTAPPHDSAEWQDWLTFRDNPHQWFIKAPSLRAAAIWALVEARQR